MLNESPKYLGEVEIPAQNPKQPQNRAQFARAVLDALNPGKASVYEFNTKKDAQNCRSMLSSMAILKWGEAGHIHTSINENVLYIWLADPSETVSKP